MGQYYDNDTPLYGPPQDNSNESQPWPGNPCNDNTPTGHWACAENHALYGAQQLVLDHYVNDWKGPAPLASSYLSHWLSDTGTPMKINVAQLMNAVPTFDEKVQKAINACEVRGAQAGYCTGTWQTAGVSRSNQNYYNAIGPSFYYEVTGYKNAQNNWVWTVNVYKYYAFIGPLAACPLPGSLCTMALASMEEAGVTQNFVIYGQYTFTQNPSDPNSCPGKNLPCDPGP
jgi:hypothetical protein